MARQLPLISLVITVYNTKPYLEACLESVARQNYPNLEIIIVDDGSTDGSGIVCDHWCERHPDSKALHTENAGPSAARNLGIDNCNGEYVVFVDSDDVVSPFYIEHLWSLISEFDDADVAMTAFTRDFAGGNFLENGSKTHSYSSSEAIEKMLYQTSGFDNSVWGKLFRKSLFDKVRFANGLLYEDLDLMYRLFRNIRRLVKHDAVDYYYRRNENGLTGRSHFSLKRLDVLSVTDNICLDSAGKSWEKAALERRFSANCNMFALLCANGMSKSLEADNCWKAIKSSRFGSLTNSSVRFKSRAGAVLSYLGRIVFGIISSKTV